MPLFSKISDLNLNPLDTLSNLFSTGYSVYQDQRNYKYQQELQKQLFARDDNAMQRRMKDYKNAGINPLMALGGSAAGNSSAGNLSSTPISIDNSFYSTQQQKKLERDTIKQEIDKRKIEMEQMKIQLRSGKIANWQAMQDLNTKRLEQDILKKQLENMNNNSFYPLSNIGKIISDVAGLGNNILPFSIVNPFPNNGLIGFLNQLYKSVSGPTPETIDKVNELGNKLQEKVDNFVQNAVTPKEKEYKVKPSKNPPISMNYQKTMKFFNDNHKNVKLYWVYDKGINPKGRGTMKLWSVSKKKYYSPNFYDYNSVIRFLKYGDYEK